MSDGFVPPQEVRNNAKRGLELRAKHNRGGTEVGVARARDLSNGKALSLDTLKRMNSYFARHEVDKKGEGWGKDSAGYIAWLLWGGDAGRAWAKRITSEQENKEKSMASNLTTTSYFSIEKADRNSDGTMTVYGKATDDSLDIDQQICDGDWLKRAMPAWFKSGGNIREQHSQIAAGVAKEYEAKADGHYIGVLVVDPVSVKKVDAGVLKGFSVGIKNPRVVRDSKAANGRIIDGQIVEISLVDRPANPNCQLVLAKSVDGEKDLVQVEELHEKEETENNNPIQSDNNSEKESDAMDTTTVSVPKSIVGDLVKFDKAQFEAAREALANLISIEAQEMKEGHNELSSLAHLLEAVSHLHAWYEGEEAEGEVMEETEIEMAVKPEEKEMMPKKGESLKEFKARCKEAGMEDGYADKMYGKYMAAEKEADADDKEMMPAKGETKEAFMNRCKEAGKSNDYAMKCWNKFMEKSNAATDMTPTAETGANLDTATIVPPADTPKSAEAEETVAEEVAEEAPAAEEVTEEVSVDENSTDKLEAIVEEVVEKATKALKSEIANLVSAKEAAEVRAMSLETELATAKSLALGGGPKRTVSPIDVKATNDLLTKAAVYKEKAKATTDITLAKGYKILADEYIAEYEKTLEK
jgi:hypothetical protein